jgi:hypothetical protein
LFKVNQLIKTQNLQSPSIVAKFAVINRASFENGHRLKSISSQTGKSNRRLQFPVFFSFGLPARHIAAAGYLPLAHLDCFLG